MGSDDNENRMIWVSSVQMMWERVLLWSYWKLINISLNLVKLLKTMCQIYTKASYSKWLEATKDNYFTNLLVKAGV